MNQQECLTRALLDAAPPTVRHLVLELYPYLRRVRVNATYAKDDMGLLYRRAARATSPRCCQVTPVPVGVCSGSLRWASNTVVHPDEEQII